MRTRGRGFRVDHQGFSNLMISHQGRALVLVPPGQRPDTAPRSTLLTPWGTTTETTSTMVRRYNRDKSSPRSATEAHPPAPTCTFRSRSTASSSTPSSFTSSRQHRCCAAHPSRRLSSGAADSSGRRRRERSNHPTVRSPPYQEIRDPCLAAYQFIAYKRSATRNTATSAIHMRHRTRRLRALRQARQRLRNALNVRRMASQGSPPVPRPPAQAGESRVSGPREQ